MNVIKGKSTEVSVKTSDSEPLYGWVYEQHMAILHLGKMRNAVVIHHSLIGNYFKIGLASYFPFSDIIINEKYNTIQEAKNVANTYITEWLNDTNLALKKQQ